MLKDWEIAEHRTAMFWEGQLQPGSGNTKFKKNDVVTNNEMISVKQTEKESYSIKLKDLNILKRQAMIEGKKPHKVIQFCGITHSRFVVLPEDDYLFLRSLLKELSGDNTRKNDQRAR